MTRLWTRGENVYSDRAKDIVEILHRYGFHTYSGKKSRLPCIIVANLITPRRDPHGYDKSRIDIQPFAGTIIEAVEKMAVGIQTYKAAGYVFRVYDDYSTARKRNIEGKDSVKALLRQFLIKERGRPDG